MYISVETLAPPFGSHAPKGTRCASARIQWSFLVALVLASIANISGAEAVDVQSATSAPHFLIGNCQGGNTFVLLAQALAADGLAVSKLFPNRPVWPNVTSSVGHVPSCGFTDEGDALLDLWRGAGTDRRPVAFVGCSCSRASTYLALLAGSLYMPVISGSATSSLLAGEDYPSFMRTVPSDFLQAACQAQLMRHYNWTHVAYLTFYTEIYGNFLATQVMSLLNSEHAVVKFFRAQPVSWRTPDTWRSFNQSLVHDDLRQNFPTNQLWQRVLAFATDNSMLYHVYLKEMLAMGIIHSNSVVLLADAVRAPSRLSRIAPALADWQAIDPTYFADPFWQDGAQFLTGSLITLPHVEPGWFAPSAAAGVDFQNWLSQLENYNLTERFGMPLDFQFPSFEEMEDDLSGRLVFDAAMTVFLAIGDLLLQQVLPDEIHGELLLDTMLSERFEGMTGEVMFDGTGERSGLLYDVMNLQSINGTATFVPVWRYVSALTAGVEGEESTQFFKLGPVVAVEGNEVIFPSGSSQHSDTLQCDPGSEARAIVEESGTRYETCQACAAGMFRSELTSSVLACQPCPLRHYAGSEGSTSCIQCGNGSYSNVLGATACEACPPGQAQPLVAQDTCAECQPGRYASSAGSSVCVSCPQGHFQQEVGSTKCIRCEPGMSTQGSEATTRSSCMCMEGTYFDEASSQCAKAPAFRHCGFGSLISDCPCQPGTRAHQLEDSCVPCERHLYCPGEHLLSENDARQRSEGLNLNLDQTVQVEEGYMTLPDDPYSVFKCIQDADTVCKGRRSPFNTSSPGRICPETVAIGPRCGQCENGRWGSPSRRCTLCDSADASVFYAKVFLSFLANLLLALYLYKRFNRPNPAGLVTLACLFSMMQSLQTVGAIPLEWPSTLKAVFNMLDYIFTLDGIMERLEFRTECLAGHSYISKLSRAALSPMLIFVDFAVLACIMWPLKRKFKWPKVHNIIGLVFTRLFITILRISLSLFYREHMPNGKTMIISIPDLEFMSQDWYHALPIGASATLLYGCSIAAYVVYLVLVAPRETSEDPDFIMKARFCFGNFRPDRHWWILVQLGYGFALNLAQVIMPASNIHSKVYLVLLFLIVFLVVEFKAQPFKFASTTAVDLMLNTFLVVLLVVATSFIPPQSVSEHREWSEIYAVIILFCFGGCLALGVYQVSRWLCTSAHAKGVEQGQRAQFGWQFRDCVVAMLLLPDAELTGRVANFGDHDLEMLKNCTETIITMLFSSQVTKNRLHQRLIPGDKHEVWSYEAMQLDVWEKIQRGKLARSVSRSYRVRGWLLQMSLEACQEWEMSEFRAPHRTTSQLASSFQGTLPHIKRVVDKLGFHSGGGIMTRSQFRESVWAAFPTLEIPKRDVDVIFNSIDINSEAVVRKSTLILTLTALVPEWMLTTILSSSLTGHTSVDVRSTEERSSSPCDGDLTSISRLETVLGHLRSDRCIASNEDGSGAHGSSSEDESMSPAATPLEVENSSPQASTANTSNLIASEDHPYVSKPSKAEGSLGDRGFAASSGADVGLQLAGPINVIDV